MQHICHNDAELYQQVFGTAIGYPVSSWKRYADVITLPHCLKMLEIKDWLCRFLIWNSENKVAVGT